MFRKLRVTVEYAYAFHLFSEKGNTERIVERIRKYIDETASDSILSRFGHEIDPHESFFGQFIAQPLVIHILTLAQGDDTAADLGPGRHFLVKRVRIRNYDSKFIILSVHYLAQCRSPLHLERRLVVASFDFFSGIGKIENPVALYKIIKIGRAIFGRILVRKHYKMQSGLCHGRKYEPACGKKEP